MRQNARSSTAAGVVFCDSHEPFLSSCRRSVIKRKQHRAHAFPRKAPAASGLSFGKKHRRERCSPHIAKQSRQAASQKCQAVSICITIPRRAAPLPCCGAYRTVNRPHSLIGPPSRPEKPAHRSPGTALYAFSFKNASPTSRRGPSPLLCRQGPQPAQSAGATPSPTGRYIPAGRPARQGLSHR